MANEIVRLADHFFAGVVADFGEGFVRFDDDALEIRARVDEFAFRQQCFNVRNRQIDLHRLLPLGLQVSFDGFCVRVWLPDRGRSAH